MIFHYFTENDSINNGRYNNLTGIMVHSTATPGVKAHEWYDRWNKSGIGKSVHAFIDDTDVYVYMPYNTRAAHSGGVANDTHIALEICEPEAYDETYFKRAWDNAVRFASYLVLKYDIKDVISHAEGFKRGIASNHGDADLFFNTYSKSMDDFRREVFALADKNRPHDYARDAVLSLYEQGILKGDNKGEWRLSDFVTREQLLIFLSRL